MKSGVQLLNYFAFWLSEQRHITSSSSLIAWLQQICSINLLESEKEISVSKSFSNDGKEQLKQLFYSGLQIKFGVPKGNNWIMQSCEKRKFARNVCIKQHAQRVTIWLLILLLLLLVLLLLYCCFCWWQSPLSCRKED